MSAPLTPYHREMLEQASGIRADVIEARGYRTVTDPKELQKLRFSSKQRNIPALVIPLFCPTGEVKLHQSRPDAPRFDKWGKAIKYETPFGSQMVLDMHPFAASKAGNPSVDLWITEGIKKGDALVSHGFCAVSLIGVWNFRGTNEHGGKTALPEWEYIALNGRVVYVVFDSDVTVKKPVQGALERLKLMLEHRGAKVKIVYLPDAEDGSKQGVDDYLAAGHTTEEMQELATSELRRFETVRPEIVVNGRFLRDISDDAVSALEAANEPPRYFLRGDMLMRVPTDLELEPKGEAFNGISLKGELDRIADFVKLTFDEEGKPETLPARPPPDLAPNILTRCDLTLPRLEVIAHAPVLLPDGELLLEDGFDEEHGILLRLKGLGALRSDLTSAQALTILRTVFADFPFVNASGFAHTLSLTLQHFVRPAIQGPTPMYLIDAPTRGTGKGLLAEVSNWIALGYYAPTMSQPKDTDEQEKRITSVLLEGRQVVFLDNVTRLGSEPLHAVLTSEVYHGRILGKSETVAVPNRAAWLASGNNVELSDEMVRRTIPIRLDANDERPETRTGFKIPDLSGYVRSHRNELVSACLSLVRAWLEVGQPKGERTLGRFESWAGIMGGILEVAGVDGFLEGRERIYAEADKETTEWAAFFQMWWKSFGPRAVTASELFDIAKEYKLLLSIWTGRRDLSARQRFGRALTSRRDRVFAAYKLQSAGKDGINNTNAYRLEAIQTPETRETQNDRQEMPSVAIIASTGFRAGLETKNPETQQEPDTASGRKSNAQDGNAALDGQVHRVSGVSPQAIADSPESLYHLIGATEGEL